MATTRARHSPPRSNERSPRRTADDHCRNCKLAGSGSAKTGHDYGCHGDERTSRGHQESKISGRHRQGETRSNHELYKLSEERTSDEGTATEAESIDTVRGDDPDFDPDPRKHAASPREYSSHGYSKSPPEPRQAAQYDEDVDDDVDEDDRSDAEVASSPHQRALRDYANSVTLRQAQLTAKKVERLKELQRRREYAEHFYTQEIRRLMGELYFSKNSPGDESKKLKATRIAGLANRVIVDASNPCEQRIRAGGVSKELKPCGTMTTITKLDCGCVKSTTTTILDGPTGRFRQCEDHRYRMSVDPNLGPSSPHQELTYRAARPLEQFANSAASPAKTKSPADFSARPKARRRSPRQISPERNVSPVRQHSDTSTNSQRA